MAAEAHLANPAAAQGPVQKLGTLTLQGPVQMMGPIDAVHCQVVNLAAAQTVEDAVELSLSVLEGQPRQDLAGDHPAVFRRSDLFVAQSLTQKLLGWSVGRSRLQMIDPCHCSGIEHLSHLLG